MAIKLIVLSVPFILALQTQATIGSKLFPVQVGSGRTLQRSLTATVPCPPAKAGYNLFSDINWKGTIAASEGQKTPADAEKICNSDPTCFAWNNYGYYITGNVAGVSYFPYTGLCTYVKSGPTGIAQKAVNYNETFLWYSNKSSWSGDLFASIDVCQNGNGGLRGLEFDRCVQLCVLLPKCQVVAYWPSWFGGPSACFAKDASQVPLMVGPTSSKPIATSDRGGYFGKKI